MLRDNYELCQFCGTDLQGAPIPEEEQNWEGAKNFSRKIRLYELGTLRRRAWMCPNCMEVWR